MDMCCDGNGWFSCEILWVVRLVSSGMVIYYLDDGEWFILFFLIVGYVISEVSGLLISLLYLGLLELVGGISFMRCFRR
jgi:hypothetical protein